MDVEEGVLGDGQWRGDCAQGQALEEEHELMEEEPVALGDGQLTGSKHFLS